MASTKTSQKNPFLDLSTVELDEVKPEEFSYTNSWVHKDNPPDVPGKWVKFSEDFEDYNAAVLVMLYTWQNTDYPEQHTLWRAARRTAQVKEFQESFIALAAKHQKLGLIARHPVSAIRATRAFLASRGGKPSSPPGVNM